MLKNLPIIVFSFFVVSICWIIFYYAPSWGLMDDCGNLTRDSFVWQNNNPLGVMWDLSLQDLKWGMFRPVYFFWASISYHLLKDLPTIFYFLVAVFNLFTIILWGIIFARIFSREKTENSFWIFIFPLLFFVFTPFWNIFMYLSLQQKFILFFNALAILALLKAYETNCLKFIYLYFALFLLSLLSHPEATHLAIVTTIIFLVDLAVTKINKRVSLVGFSMNLFFIFLYLIFTFTVQFKGSYVSRYEARFNINSIVSSIMHASVVIKILISLALINLCLQIFVLFKPKNHSIKQLFILIFPLGLLGCGLILAPVGFITYHLSIFTPFIIGIFGWFYYFIAKNIVQAKYLAAFVIIFLSLLSVFYIFAPRISKISDIKYTVNFIKSANSRHPSNFLLPPPCEEATPSLGYLSGADATYLEKGVLQDCYLKSGFNNYLVLRDECSQVNLEDVKIDTLAYQNNTWKIYSVVKSKGEKYFIKPEFKENPIEIIKTKLKNLK